MDEHTGDEYEKDMAVIAGQALALAYRLFQEVPVSAKNRDPLHEDLQRLAYRYREALREDPFAGNNLPFPIPEHLKPTMKQFGKDLVKVLGPFLESLEEGNRKEGKGK